MKYTIIICLLFALSNSLKEFNNKFSKIESLLMGNYVSNIEDKVCDADTKDKCKALPNLEDDHVCCYYEILLDDEKANQYCQSSHPDMYKLGKVVNSKVFYPFLREVNGYKKIVEKAFYPNKTEVIVTCKKGAFRIVYNSEYSEKEKNVFKDENHCLNIYHKKLDNSQFNVGECENYLLLDSSKKAGLDCGYFEYNITLESKTTISYKTCNVFNLNLFSYIREGGNIRSEFIEEDLDDIIRSMGYTNDNLTNYSVEVLNSKGQKIKYDSRTGEVIIKGAGYMLSISKYLFILIFILFYG